MESVTQFFPPSTGRIGQSKNTLDNLDQGDLSRFQAGHVKAAQRTKVLSLLEVFLAGRHKKHPRP